MNILFFTSEYVSHHKGGVERVTFLLHKAFVDNDINSYIISLNSKAIDEEGVYNHFVLPQNKSVEYLCDFVKKNYIDIIINNSHNISVINSCSIVKQNYDCKVISVCHTAPKAIIINIFDELAPVLLQQFSVKKVIALLSWIIRYPYRYVSRKKYLKQKLRKYFDGSDAVVLLSENFKPEYKNLIDCNYDNKIYCIPNPIYIVENCLTPKKKQILFVGRMIFSAKRPDRMIRIWEKIYHQFPDWELYMLGDGPDKGRLEDYCKDKKIKNIIFTGNVNPVPYYESASVLCMTSSYEGFGMVLVEALKYKCIPIAYNSFAALSDIIIDGVNGYAIPPFKENIFVEKLQYLMSNADERERLAANNTVTLDKFDINKVSQQWLELFDNLLK